jgi:hypothetical protein
LAVSWIANSSSVNNDAESNGSSQLNATGACAWRFEMMVDLATLAKGLRNAVLIMVAIYSEEKENSWRKE